MWWQRGCYEVEASLDCKSKRVSKKRKKTKETSITFEIVGERVLKKELSSSLRFFFFFSFSQCCLG